MKSSASKRYVVGKDTPPAVPGPAKIVSSIEKKQPYNDELIKLQQDLDLISRKLTDLNGQPGAPSGTNSGVVASLRMSVANERTIPEPAAETKLRMLETIISRLGELDRAVSFPFSRLDWSMTCFCRFFVKRSRLQVTKPLQVRRRGWLVEWIYFQYLLTCTL